MSAQTTAIIAALTAGLALAAPMKRDDMPFKLVVNSLNSDIYYKTPVTACHDGAAIESLCVAVSSTIQNFTFAATSDPAPYPNLANPGYIEYTLQASPTSVQQPLGLVQNGTSNVSPAFFGGSSNPVKLTYRTEGAFGVVDGDSTADDWVWYICPYLNAGIQYQVVNHVTSGETPDRDDCEEVELARALA